MLYNRCTGIYKFGNNMYPRRIRSRSNLGHIFPKKSASYGPGKTVYPTHAFAKSLGSEEPPLKNTRLKVLDSE